MRTALDTATSTAPTARVRDTTPTTPRFTADDRVVTPTSHSMLFMSPAAEELDGADIALFDEFASFLTSEHGWESDDFEIKYNRAADGYATLSFEDFFRIEEYGVIVICAHAIYRDATDTDSDPFNFGFRVAADSDYHYYIQVTAADAYFDDGTSTPDPYDFGFRTADSIPRMERIDVEAEMARGRIVPVARTDTFKKTLRSYLYMREDLWRENLEDLSNSFVYVLAANAAALPTTSGTPDPFNFGFRVINGRQARVDVLSGKHVGSFMGWDQVVTTQAGLDAAWIIPLMAKTDRADVEVWQSGDIATELSLTTGLPADPDLIVTPPDGSDPFGFGFRVMTPDPGTANAKVLDPGDRAAHLELWPFEQGVNNYLFLPTWANTGAVNYPDDTVTIRTTVSYADESVPLPDITSYQDVPHSPNTFEGLIPGQEATFEFEALNSYNEILGTTEETITLRTGANTIEADFAFDVSTRFLMFEGYDVDSTARNSTWGWRYYLAWDEVPGATYYDVTITRNGNYTYDRQEEVSVVRVIKGQNPGLWAPTGYGPGIMLAEVVGGTVYYNPETETQPSAEILTRRSTEIGIVQSWSYAIQPYYPED